MDDIILSRLFEHDRWQKAIDKGIVKDITKSDLEYLSSPSVIASVYRRIRDRQYRIAPPHTALIPKDDGTFRTVYANTPIDRILLSVINDLLFDLTPDMIHPSCKSYQRGIGCGKVVQDISRHIVMTQGRYVGFKSDLRKYFDSVPIQYIDRAFDSVETRYGHSVVIDLLRDYYHSDLYFDTDKNLCTAYQSLKQGCAVASWLADVILYDVDVSLSGLDGIYCRYSDDILYIGPDHEKALSFLRSLLNGIGLDINEKKTELLTHDRWFKFLGFSIRGSQITLSRSRIKTFQREVLSRTVRAVYQQQLRRKDRSRPSPSVILSSVTRSVNHYLYQGDGLHSWATQVLPIINCEHDIYRLNEFVIDAIRAAVTGRRRIGGLGFTDTLADRCILRGRGRNVTANRRKLPHIPDFYPLQCMRDVIRSSRSAFDTVTRGLGLPGSHTTFDISIEGRSLSLMGQTLLSDGSADGCTPISSLFHDSASLVQALTQLYLDYKHSRPDTISSSVRHPYFHAVPLDLLDPDDSLLGRPRSKAMSDLETFLFLSIHQQALSWADLFPSPSQADRSFYWQSPIDSDFVLLRSWFVTLQVPAA